MTDVSFLFTEPLLIVKCLVCKLFYISGIFIYTRTSDPLVKVNSTQSLTASTLLHRLVLSALFTQCPGDTVQTWTGQLDPARKFKCTAAARVYYLTARIDVVKYSHSNQCNFWKARWINSIFSYNKCNGVEFTEVTRSLKILQYAVCYFFIIPVISPFVVPCCFNVTFKLFLFSIFFSRFLLFCLILQYVFLS